MFINTGWAFSYIQLNNQISLLIDIEFYRSTNMEIESCDTQMTLCSSSLKA